MVEVLPDTIKPNGVYTPSRACELLQIGSTTLWRYTVAGLIQKRVRPGQKRGLYTGADLIKLHRNIVII